MNDEMIDIGFARLSLSRRAHTGMAETVYCLGMPSEQPV